MRIGLGFDLESYRSHSYLRGISNYLREHRGWSTQLVEPTARNVAEFLSGKPDGFLTATADDVLLELLEHAGVATVVLGERTLRQLGQVLVDESEIGGIAVEHFTTRGYRHFGYVGSDSALSSGREHAFGLAVERAGFCYEKFGLRSLATCRKPVGLLCESDAVALAVSERCRLAKLEVPQAVAILGVGDHESVCGLGEPPISSVQLPFERTGYEAATLLGHSLDNQQKPTQTILLPPTRVVNRSSTDAVAVGDRLVGHAMELMRSHLAGPVGILEVCRKLKCSRRMLERRFSASTGFTPAQAWARFRVEEAQRLLVDTDLSVETIATRTGFGDGRRVTLALRRATGRTPSALRRSLLC